MEQRRTAFSRRNLLRGSLAAGAASLVGAPGACAEQAATAQAGEAPPAAPLAPTRPLGRSGVQVPIISIGGAMRRHTVEFLEAAWDRGVRYFDTARIYTTNTANGRSEENIADFFAKHPGRREQCFLVTKSYLRGEEPEALLRDIDERLDKCGVDQIDLFLLHAAGPEDYGRESLEWFEGDRVRRIADQLKESGKIKLFGFSTHNRAREEYLFSAARGAWVDAILVTYSPFVQAGERINEAMDACHGAGIGLIAMKEMRWVSDLPKRSPEMDALGLTNHQALLHACWSDPRIASVCSSMENEQHIEENMAAACSFESPMTADARGALGRVLAGCRPAMCPNCDGRCQTAAGTTASLGDIARYVAYYEQDGAPAAREWYRAMDAARRDAAGADLFAAHRACPAHLDFEAIVRKAERYFA